MRAVLGMVLCGWGFHLKGWPKYDSPDEWWCARRDCTGVWVDDRRLP